jgi:hypothetical protein
MSSFALAALPSIDVNCLAPHELADNGRSTHDNAMDMDSNDILKYMAIASHIPSRCDPISRYPENFSVLIYGTKKQRLAIPLKRMLSVHDLHPSFHSISSYNSLIELAIRHTAYSVAFRTLRRMNSCGIKSDDCTCALYVRLLVRTCQRDRAWSYIRSILAHGVPKNMLHLFAELLGNKDATYLRTQSSARASEARTADQSTAMIIRNIQKLILSTIAEQPRSKVADRLLLPIIRSLLQFSENDVAHTISIGWVTHLSGFVSRSQRRTCLDILHLLLSQAKHGSSSFFRQRAFALKFLQAHRSLRPNSTTVFMLLRPLTRAQGNATEHALQLVHIFRKLWGDRVIDSRVRRRIVHIATREGRLKVATRWSTDEARVSDTRDRIALANQARYDHGQDPLYTASSRSLAVMEKMRWKWTRRRLWAKARRRRIEG